MQLKKMTLACVAVLGMTTAAWADINVGVTLSATGPAASLGIPEKNTISLLPQTIGGQKVNYIVLDDALRAAAVGGQGLVYEPSFIVGDDVAQGRLQALTLDHPARDLGGIHAVWPANRHPPAKVRAMVDFLATRLAGRGPGA